MYVYVCVESYLISTNYKGLVSRKPKDRVFDSAHLQR